MKVDQWRREVVARIPWIPVPPLQNLVLEYATPTLRFAGDKMRTLLRLSGVYAKVIRCLAVRDASGNLITVVPHSNKRSRARSHHDPWSDMLPPGPFELLLDFDKYRITQHPHKTANGKYRRRPQTTATGKYVPPHRRKQIADQSNESNESRTEIDRIDGEAPPWFAEDPVDVVDCGPRDSLWPTLTTNCRLACDVKRLLDQVNFEDILHFRNEPRCWERDGPEEASRVQEMLGSVFADYRKSLFLSREQFATVRHRFASRGCVLQRKVAETVPADQSDEAHQTYISLHEFRESGVQRESVWHVTTEDDIERPTSDKPRPITLVDILDIVYTTMWWQTKLEITEIDPLTGRITLDLS